ncbi:MAG: class I SAM-dependent methyltransferase [Gemmatimonadales bacterium]|jgi:SAM-dependent methyltransferase|nr:MAG: class I SAM-dependent methyltransferase [Gemmatimonadales bacterium]
MPRDERPSDIWDTRYSAEDYLYGTEPNDFLREHASSLPEASRTLCLAEGQGRNAVFLAGLGHRVVAVDRSRVGLERARHLAHERGVVVETVTADLAELHIEPGGWDAVISIWCHLPSDVRADLHRRVVQGLKPGGVLVLEAYTPRQLEYGTGGPPDPDRLVRLEELRDELAGLDLEVALETEREIHEGTKHHGPSHVVQVVARSPTPVSGSSARREETP